uniref:Uncharacterized protein n=1 Tax=Glossina palpalis gambiensis TaxID=67801 RepID=A0A1B0C6U4_9MUSC
FSNRHYFPPITSADQYEAFDGHHGHEQSESSIVYINFEKNVTRHANCSGHISSGFCFHHVILMAWRAFVVHFLSIISHVDKPPLQYFILQSTSFRTTI